MKICQKKFGEELSLHTSTWNRMLTFKSCVYTNKTTLSDINATKISNQYIATRMILCDSY